MYKLVVLPLLILCLLAVGCQQKQAEATTSEAETAAKEILNKYLEIFNTGNMALVNSVIDTAHVTTEPGVDGKVMGREGFTEWVKAYRTAYPDFNLTFDDVIIKDENIVVHWTVTGTQKGMLREVPPTGKRIRVQGLTLFRTANGMIKEQVIYYDNLGASMQLGSKLIPPEA